MKQCFLPVWLLCSALLISPVASAQSKAPAPLASITLDEFMNATEITGAKLSPDGTAVVVATVFSDWEQNRFAENLWLWSVQTRKLIPLTLSGHDSSPQWSPDGKTIAFLSDRPTSLDAPDPPAKTEEEPARVWLITVAGGEPVPLYREPLDVHAFAWTRDGTGILVAATNPQSKDEEASHQAAWKDVIRWREEERGDVLLSIPRANAFTRSDAPAAALSPAKPPADKPALPAGSRVLTHSALSITEIAPSPHGSVIAFETGPISRRLERPEDAELYVVPAAGGDARALTHNQGAESDLRWSPDEKSIDLLVRAAGGSIEGPYQDVQGRLYSIDVASGKTTRLGADFQGSWEGLAMRADGTLLAAGNTGMDQRLYKVTGARSQVVAGKPGNYAHLDVAEHGNAVLFTHSTITSPTQVFLSGGGAHLDEAEPVTTFNTLFNDRAQVEWKPYRWKSADGTEVEGVLLYPPGRQDAHGLRMLTLIHGGPADADGNRWGADWYDWAPLAAARGWLVFRPNYRGSTGYGDAFMSGIRPHLVSAPGADILAGVDSLVHDGIADPNHLAIGGYSYGGYMTNWLITQTTRFRSAVTGAGAVEHAANWGNDDLTFDDAWYLSGTPWEKPELYQSEAALFQLNKVTTPTHIVGGNADNRVSYLEQVLFERALQQLNVPHALLVFPGESHPLNKNPWHGYIKVREELNWLETFDAK